MLDSLRQEVTQKLGQIQPMTEAERAAMIEEMAAQQAAAVAAAREAEGEVTEGGPVAEPAEGFVEDDPSTWGNPGRNDTCPCGSST